MMKNYKKILLFVCLLAILVLPQMILAADPEIKSPLQLLDEVGSGAAGPFQTPPVDSKTQLLNMIGTVVGVALSLVGTIFLILMIFAGYNWMTAQGEEEKVTKAKSIIIQSIIGIAIVVGSYAAWAFISSKLF